jgi:adenosylcobinamide kinase / adenosylcobinamide-phosphate guanylyltransferase
MTFVTAGALHIGMLTVITGGCRSGKSAQAITTASASQAPRKFFIATAEGLDDEMRARIAHHQRFRPAEFQTIEEPQKLAAALRSLHGRADVVVVDCVTLWISNLLTEYNDDTILAEVAAVASLLVQATFASIVVTDEVGWGIVPENPVARRFRDLLGWTNQKIARVADEVLLMAAGYALRLK